MCGIAGVAGAFSPDEGEALVRRMTGAMVHRGPDDEGFYVRPGLVMGMRRLAIVDVEGGRQPMETPGGTAVVLNGEIYNHGALRERLKEKGRRFLTRSDTEVIPHLYEDQGEASFRDMDGMFGIAMYDPHTQELVLARDALGIKPLYYGWHDGRFYFASELKAILAALPRNPAVNREAIHHYLTLRFVPPEQCIWQGMRKLPPGHWLRLSLKSGEFHEMTWFDWHFQPAAGPGEEDEPQRFAKLFESNVRSHLESSDVPVGVLLSGGLDSSTVSAAAIKLGHENFHTFSVGFEDGGEFNELAFARVLARHLNSRHHEVTLDHHAFLKLFPKVIHHLDEPLADLAAVPLLAVSELAAEQVKVVLSGEGSDELLAGYDLEQQAAKWETLRRLDKLPGALKSGLGRLPSARTDSLGRLASARLSGYLAATGSHITRYFSEDEKNAMWLERPRGTGTTEELIRSWYGRAISLEPLDQMQEVLCHGWLVEDLLMKADKMSMAASVELRVPFLTAGMAAYCAALPADWKVGNKRVGWRSKRLLRVYARGLVPEEILTRPKQGFPVPAYLWLTGPLKEWAGRFLFDEAVFVPSLFRMDPLRPVFARAVAGSLQDAHRIWLMLVLEQWGRLYALH